MSIPLHDRLSARITEAATGQISWNLILRILTKIKLEITILLQWDKIIRDFTWRPQQILLLLATPTRHNSAQFEWNICWAFRIAEDVQSLRERATMLRYSYIA